MDIDRIVESNDSIVVSFLCFTELLFDGTKNLRATRATVKRGELIGKEDIVDVIGFALFEGRNVDVIKEVLDTDKEVHVGIITAILFIRILGWGDESCRRHGLLTNTFSELGFVKK